jgi:hypothetical protein
MIQWWVIFCALLGVAAAFALTGCGLTSERQAKTVEVEQYELGPMQIDTPAGTVTVHQPAIRRKRTTVTVEEGKTGLEFPEATAVLSAAGSGLLGPLGGAGIMGLIGAGALAWMRKKNAAEQAGLVRQRNEIADGVERAKAELTPEQWKAVRLHLEAEQSADTKAAIKARLG